MDPDRKLAIFFTALMATLSALVFWGLAAPRICSFAGALDSKSSGACFDFWLNRYQTLLGGIFTLAGAGLAAFFVARQTRVARNQLDVMLGDVEPAFYLFRADTGMGYVSLQIRNENRLPLTLSEAVIEAPVDLQFFNVRHPNVVIATISEDGRQAILKKIVIDGTRPSAPKVQTDRVDFLFAMKGTKTGTKLPTLRLKLSFSIQGGSVRHAFVETQDATTGAEITSVTSVPY